MSPHAAYLTAACTLLALGWGALALVYTRSPGFNDALLVEGVRGNERTEDVAVMYDHGLYLTRQGYGYLMADLFPFNDEGLVYEVASGEARTARVAQAEDLFRHSLQRDPANAFTWIYYTHALLKREDVDNARRALERAWDLAPTTEGVAARRQAMVLTIREFSEDPDAYDDMFRQDAVLLAARAPADAGPIGEIRDNPEPIGQSVPDLIR